jgi:hypothetical protein
MELVESSESQTILRLLIFGIIVRNCAREANMTDPEPDSIIDSLFRMPRFGPALFSAFLVGLLLLFLDKMSWRVKVFLVPSIVIYSMGTAFLGFLHRHLGLHYVGRDDRNNEKPIPVIWKVVLFAAHLGWLVALIFYNFSRGVL